MAFKSFQCLERVQNESEARLTKAFAPGNGNQGTAVCLFRSAMRRKKSAKNFSSYLLYRLRGFSSSLQSTNLLVPSVFRGPVPRRSPSRLSFAFSKNHHLLSSCVHLLRCVCAYYYPLSSFLPLAFRAPLTNVTHYSCSLLSFINPPFFPFYILLRVTTRTLPQPHHHTYMLLPEA